jgi:hypothetical protein
MTTFEEKRYRFRPKHSEETKRKISKTMFKGGSSTTNHRLAAEIMERHIGRKLNCGETIHHIDHNPENNDLNNLYIFKNRSEHRKYNLMEDFTTRFPSLKGKEQNRIAATLSVLDEVSKNTLSMLKKDVEGLSQLNMDLLNEENEELIKEITALKEHVHLIESILASILGFMVAWSIKRTK